MWNFCAGLKFSASKAEYLLAAARAPRGFGRSAAFRACANCLRIMRAIAGDIRGVGPWTVQYVFLRGRFCRLPAGGRCRLARGLAALDLAELGGERPDEAGVKRALDRLRPFAVWRPATSGQA